MLAAVGGEYERRIRAASLVTEYGAAHGGHGHGHDEPAEHDSAEIVNLPRGARRPTFRHDDDPAGL
jgi:uncharacterized protein YifE (UPF0438 family)